MWILPKPLHTSAFVADMKALDLDSEEFSQICEKSLTWRGKDSLSQTWLQRWKRENWMQHLCSRTLKPSHTESFVDKWTSSLEDSRVSHSQLLESVKLLKTPDTCSPTSQTELESANLELFSLKTYKESSPAKQQTESQFSNMSSESWKDWVTEQRQEYSQRKKSAHLTNASEFSSLGWPTASVAGCVEGGVAKNVEMTSGGFKATRENGTSYGAKLRDAVIHHEKNWATPQTFDANNLVRTPEKLAQTRAEKNAGCMNLREQVHYPDMDHSRKAAQNWPTIQASEPRQGYQDRTRGKKGSQKSLTTVVMDGHQDQANLNTNGKNQESWSTPQARDWKGAEGRAYKGQTKDFPAQTETTGKLNPDWVEQLMGLPVGWTQL
jgi:hypothetical protein